MKINQFQGRMNVCWSSFWNLKKDRLPVKIDQSLNVKRGRLLVKIDQFLNEKVTQENRPVFEF
jgi:hypothetical protein